MADKKIWLPERKAGLERMAAFANRAGRGYANSRNFDFGPDNRDNVSLMSPYLRRRLVLEEELLACALRLHSLGSAEKFVQEVFWRAYFKGWLEHRPTVWTDYRSAVRRLLDSLESSADLNAHYQSAISGQTGIDCFDAWAAELVRTGYLHNHARMWFASIWIFTLELPWQLGADFFYRHLLDGDPASNTLSWRWVGGLHTAGKTYLARASNIARYTDNRFNPQGQLARSAPPLSESIEHRLRQLPAAHTGPLTMQYGLFLTEEDCHPESLLQDDNPSCILGAVAGTARSPLATGHHAAEFACAAVRDALRRAEQTFGVHGEHAADDDWGSMLGDWAQRENIRFIVTTYAPAGPVADRLVQARAALSARDIQLVQVRRGYDTLAWPDATKGYFKLKARIPGILASVGLVPPPEQASAPDL